MHVMLNMDGERARRSSCRSCPGASWHRALDTSLPSPDDIAEDGQEVAIDGSTYIVNGHSVVVLISK